MDIRAAVLETLTAALRENQAQPPAVWSDDQPLLQTGLDSLGYAVVVTRLEQTLGYDPFLLLEEPVYPRTVGEFVAIYERFRAHAR